MHPRIQYANAVDGVRIAFWTLGEGPPLIVLPSPPLSHIQQEWQLPELRLEFERLARNRTVIRYDCRGCGLSERKVDEFTLDAFTLDLEAVVDVLGLKSFALYAPFYAAALGVTYCVNRPDRVSHLVLYCPSNILSQLALDSAKSTGLRSLLDTDWEMYTESFAHAALGWEHGQAAHRYAQFIRECVTPQVARRLIPAVQQLDVSTLLPRVTTPTLVLYPRRFEFESLSIAREAASRIPGARLALFEKSPLNDLEDVTSAIHEFVTAGSAAYPDGLSEREVEVLRLIAVGKSNRDIAEHLTISLHTVVRHVSNILAKTGAANRAEAATYANRNRLVPW